MKMLENIETLNQLARRGNVQYNILFSGEIDNM